MEESSVETKPDTEQKRIDDCNKKTGLNFQSFDEFNMAIEKLLIELGLPVPTPGENDFPNNGCFPCTIYENIVNQEQISELKKYQLWERLYFHDATRGPLREVLNEFKKTEAPDVKKLIESILEISKLMEKLKNSAYQKRQFNGSLMALSTSYPIGQDLVENASYALQLEKSGPNMPYPVNGAEIMPELVNTAIALISAGKTEDLERYVSEFLAGENYGKIKETLEAIRASVEKQATNQA